MTEFKISCKLNVAGINLVVIGIIYLDKIIDYVIPILHSVLTSGARPLECN